MPDALSGNGGMAQALVPNAIIKPTPAGPVTLPLPSLAVMASALKPTMSMKAKDGAMGLALKDTMTPTTNGDQAAIPGAGQMSGTVGMQATIKMGSMVAKSEGRPLAMQMSMTAHNGPSANATPGMVTQVAPTKLKLMG